MTFPLRGRRHWQRYREIAQILLRHGFDQFIDVLELAPFVSWPARWFRQRHPTEATAPIRLRLALEDLGPTFIKLGQILSTRPDVVPPNYLLELSRLQDSAPAFSAEEARGVVEAELGRPLDELFLQFDQVPIAAASLGQVHRATLRSGERVVVKVQRPAIHRRVDTDLEILFDLARLAQSRTPLGNVYDLTEIAQEFAATLQAELDYQREGRNAERFRRNFADDPVIRFPRVYWEYTTSRVLVLEEMSGVKINDLAGLDAAKIDRHRLALESARLLVIQVFVHHFFHADPHPGNFYVMPPSTEGGPPRIGAMDFGMVGWIDPRTREHLMRVLVGIARQDVEGIVDEFIRMGVVNWALVDRPRLERELRMFLNRYRGLPLREWRAQDMLKDLIPMTFHHHLHFPSELWLLGKTMAMAEGVGRQLDPEFDLFAVAEPYARELYLESVSPRQVGRRAIESLYEWGEELVLLPEQLRRVVERFERGELEVTVRHQGLTEQVQRVDRMVSRLTAAILIAAFIVAVSLLVPLLGSETWRLLAAALILLGFVNATVLTVWLVISTLPWQARRP